MKTTKLGAVLLAAYALFAGVMLHGQGRTFAERAAARAGAPGIAEHGQLHARAQSLPRG